MKMRKVTMVLMGVGGYGSSYLEIYRCYADPAELELVGAVDPMAEKSPHFEWLRERNIPIYDTAEDFYREHSADLAIIATPTLCHKELSICALEHGSEVLCEKPLVPVLQDLEPLRQAVAGSGHQLAVGFQWSTTPCMVRLKNDACGGRFGAPKRMRTWVSWPRMKSYYTGSSWKGRIADPDGRYILDSIVTNAASHYLHHIFYMMGKSTGESAMPREVLAEIYRAKEIETFDTCFLKGSFPGGCEFLYTVSHSTREDASPRFLYEFEDASVTYNLKGPADHILAEYRDGRVEDYGEPLTLRNQMDKMFVLADHVRNHTPLTCTLETIRPHLTVSNAIFELDRVSTFPKEMLRTEERSGSELTFVDGLDGNMLQCFKEFRLPSEEGFSWAGPAVPLKLDGYTAFSGHRFEN